MPTDATTQHLGIPKPHPDNKLPYDMARIILGFDTIDGLINALNNALAGLAASDHQHVIGDIDGLQSELTSLANSIAAVSNTFESLSDTEVGDASQGMVLQYLNDKWTSVAAKASFFAIDPIDGINSPSVQGALGELQAAIDALLENAPPEFDTLKELADELISAGGRIEEATPPGSVSYFAMRSAPTGWLKADGSVLTRAAYPELDAAMYCGDIRNDWAEWGYRCTNPADATNTRDIAGDYIVLPDLRGEFLRAWDDGRGVDAGRSFYTSQSDLFGSHTHTVDPPSATTSSDAHTHTIYSRMRNYYQSGASSPASINDSQFEAFFNDYMTTSSDSHSHTLNIGAFQSNSSGGSETRPRNVALLACIKY